MDQRQEMGSSPIIQSLWIGESLSVMEQLCIVSFLQNGHPFHLYTYDEVAHVPDGAELKDAHAIVDRDRVFKYRDHDSYAGFANLFRYKLLLEKGNYWCDTDTVCLKPYDHTDDYVFSSQRIRRKKPGIKRKINVGTIKAPPHSPVLEYCYDKASGKDPGEITWGETGPNLFSEAVIHFGLEQYVREPQQFNPVNWYDWQLLIDPSPSPELLNGACSVHLWNEMWRRADVDRAGTFPADSLYEQLKQRYLQTQA